MFRIYTKSHLEAHRRAIAQGDRLLQAAYDRGDKLVAEIDECHRRFDQMDSIARGFRDELEEARRVRDDLIESINATRDAGGAEIERLTAKISANAKAAEQDSGQRVALMGSLTERATEIKQLNYQVETQAATIRSYRSDLAVADKIVVSRDAEATAFRERVATLEARHAARLVDLEEQTDLVASLRETADDLRGDLDDAIGKLAAVIKNAEIAAGMLGGPSFVIGDAKKFLVRHNVAFSHGQELPL